MKPTAEEIKSLKIIIVDLLRHKMPRIELENVTVTMNRLENILVWNDITICHISYTDRGPMATYSAWWKELTAEEDE